MKLSTMLYTHWEAIGKKHGWHKDMSPEEWGAWFAQEGGQYRIIRYDCQDINPWPGEKWNPTKLC